MNRSAVLQVHLWTRSEYDRAVAAGLFDGKHVELIEGQIVAMAPMGSLHATAVALTAKAVERAFGPGYFVRWQMPFNVGESSEPEPDIAVVAGEVRDFGKAHPATAALIVEVAETSLEYDRTVKAGVYAKAGIADYWIVNVMDYRLEVYRSPRADATQVHGFGYVDETVLMATDVVTPLAAPRAAIAVADLLP